MHVPEIVIQPLLEANLLLTDRCDLTRARATRMQTARMPNFSHAVPLVSSCGQTKRAHRVQMGVFSALMSLC